MFVLAGGPGRPSLYCRRSHRQRAYESRRVAEARGLQSDEVLISKTAWLSLRDAIYSLEAGAQDAVGDMEDAEIEGDYIAVIRSLIATIGQLTDQDIEPRAVG